MSPFFHQPLDRRVGQSRLQVSGKEITSYCSTGFSANHSASHLPVAARWLPPVTPHTTPLPLHLSRAARRSPPAPPAPPRLLVRPPPPPAPPPEPPRPLPRCRASSRCAAPPPAPLASSRQRSTTCGGKRRRRRGRRSWGWIGFLRQVLLQILHGTPSCAQLLSFVCFSYLPLPSPAASDQTSSEVAFMSIRSETRQTGLLSGRPRLSPWSTSREYKDHVKDLCCMSEEFSRIVILDTNPLSFTVKPLNGIPCVPSSGELYQVYTFLLLPDWCALKIYHDLSGSVAMWLYIGYLFLFEDDDHMSLP